MTKEEFIEMMSKADRPMELFNEACITETFSEWLEETMGLTRGNSTVDAMILSFIYKIYEHQGHYKNEPKVALRKASIKK